MQSKSILGILFAFIAGYLFLTFRLTATEQIAVSKSMWFQKPRNNVLPASRDSVPSLSQYTDAYKSLWDISNDFKNYWLYFYSIISKTRYSNQTKTISDGYMSINSELTKLIRISQAERQRNLQRLAQYVRDKIDQLQNPANCEKTNLLLCDVANLCGFGCSLHTTVSCLMRAVLSNRTLVFRSKNWQYAEEGWEYAFLPVGKCKNNWKIDSAPMLENSGENQVERVLSMSTQPTNYLAWKIPREIAPTLLKLHGHPFAWWVSQFTTYVFRLQPRLKLKLDNIAKTIGFTPSAAGMHVRWGDKIRKEAGKHEVGEYMFFIEKWFKQLEIMGEKPERTVFLAFEHPRVLRQLKAKYPNYTFLTARLLFKSVTDKERYQHSGLESVIMDIYFLSKCDYLVCTQSSSVCRTAYELMMNKHADASARFQTIDTFYTLKTTGRESWFATMDHNPGGLDEIVMKKGDNISLRLKPPTPPHNDGFFEGTNIRTKKSGRFPLFKTREKIQTIDVPSFRDYYS